MQDSADRLTLPWRRAVGAFAMGVSIAGSFTGAAGAADPAVFGGRVFAVAELPESVASLDVDRDGHLDLVVVAAATVTVLKGDGKGGFTILQQLPGGNAGLAVADVTGDGVGDLLVGSTTADFITLYTGSATGVFALGTPLATGSGPASVLVADLNGDGLPDIATGNVVSQSISLLMGQGAGAFARADLPAPINAGLESIDAADMDNDGDLDLVSLGGDVMTIHFNSGQGVFGASRSLPAGVNPRSLQLGDFNSDGLLDAVFLNPASNRVSLVQQFLPGAFLPIRAITVGMSPERVRSMDLDGDGDLDLVVAQPFSTFAVDTPGSVRSQASLPLTGGEVRVLRNIGGSFLLSSKYYAGAWPRSFAQGDFNEDGIIDLATTSRAIATSQSPFITDNRIDRAPVVTTLGYISVALGQRGLRFASAERVLSGGALDIVLADVDNDGDLDLVEGRSFGFQVRQNNGDGVFDVSISGVNTSGLLPANASFALARLDDDQNLDLVTASTEGVKVAFGDGTGLFSPLTVVAPGVFQSVVVCDVNGDNRNDIIAGELMVNAPDQCVILLNGGPAGFFRAGNTPIGAQPVDIAVADFNSDGASDAAFANRSGKSVSIVLINQAGGFISTQTITVPGTPVGVRAADFDLDGDTDLAVAISSATGGAMVIRNDGGGQFSIRPQLGSFTSSRDLAAGDVNLDGWPDVLVSDSDQDRVHIFLNDQAGGFIDAGAIITGDNPRSFALADIDGDDRQDLVVARQAPFTPGPGVGSFNFVMVHRGIAVGPVKVGDLTGDGVVGAADLVRLISMWGPCAPTAPCPADFNADGVVDSVDLATLLANWG